MQESNLRDLGSKPNWDSSNPPVNIQDSINGGFEFFGGAVNWINVARVLKDKKVRGVSSIPAFVFTAWGVWNLYYYPHLDQWMSFMGGLVIVAANAVWVALAWKYRNA